MTAPEITKKSGPASRLPGSAKRSGQAPRPATRRRAPRMGRVAVWWWAAPAVLLVLALHYGGMAAGSVYAFTDWRGLGPFKFVGLDNFVDIFQTPKASQALWNTLFLAAGFLVLTNVIGLAFAVALNRQLKSRHFLRVLLFMPVVLSPLAVSYIWKFIFQPQGPLNDLLKAVGLGDWTRAWLGDPASAIWTILLVMVWQHIGLTMVLYLAGLANVPEELEEAAAVDGAGPARRFYHVVLPLLRPTIVIASTLILVQGLRVFDQVQAMTAGGPFNATETLSTLVFKETFVSGRYGYGAALSLLLTVLIAFFALLQIVLLRGKKED